MLKNYINDVLERESLTDQDVAKYIDKIYLYDDLRNFRNIDELLNNPQQAVCILVPTNGKLDGHWTLLFRTSYGIEYFDSYGKPPDFWLEKCKDQPERPYLTELLRTTTEPIYYNTHSYQKKGSSTATCGRFTILRFLFRHLDGNMFKKIFSGQLTIDPDELVSLLI